MDLEDQPSAVGIDHGVTLTPVDLLAGIIAPRATGLGVFTLRLSMIAALGLASRPTRSRSSITSWWFRRAAPPGRVIRPWLERMGLTVATRPRRMRRNRAERSQAKWLPLSDLVLVRWAQEQAPEAYAPATRRSLS